MKKSDIIFWTALGAMALFYYFIGNDIYRDHYKKLGIERSNFLEKQKENKE